MRKKLIGLLCVLLLPAVFFGQDAQVPVAEAPPLNVKILVTSNQSPMPEAKVLLDTVLPGYTDRNGLYSGSVEIPSFSVQATTPEGEHIGRYWIVIQEDNALVYNREPGAGESRENEEKPVEIILDKAERLLELTFVYNPVYVSGRVTEGNIPVARARIMIAQNRIIHTDNTGVYETRAQEGQLRIMATSEQGEFIGEQSINLADGERGTADFTFNPGTVEVLVKQDGTVPVENARVFAGRNAPAATGKDGRCIQKVLPGLVHIYVRNSRGKLVSEKTVTVYAGKTTLVDVNL